MPTIAIDATYATDLRPTGVSVYSRRLIESLASMASPYRFRIGYRFSRWRRRQRFIQFRESSRTSRPSNLYFQEPWTFWLPHRADLFHSLAQRPAPFRFRREIVTILDAFPLAGRGYSSPDFQRKFSALLIEAQARADLVITPSEYTATELERLAGTNKRKIRVVPLGVDLPRDPEAGFDALRERERWAGAGNELVLVVGVIQTRKNTLGALKALQRLPPRYHMVLVGGDGYGSEPAHSFIRTAGLASRVSVVGYAERATLDRLYRASSMLLFPSFEEGFGLPVLEAMAYGLPAIVSKTSSLPEVAGDAALYVDPADEDGIALQVERLAEDAPLRQRLIQRGLKRAPQFSWPRVAASTMAVYGELLQA